MAQLTYMYNTRVLQKTKSPIGYRRLMTHLALFWKPLEHSPLIASVYLSATDHSLSVDRIVKNILKNHVIRMTDYDQRVDNPDVS
jgi:hypothetical protein